MKSSLPSPFLCLRIADGRDHEKAFGNIGSHCSYYGMFTAIDASESDITKTYQAAGNDTITLKGLKPGSIYTIYPVSFKE